MEENHEEKCRVCPRVPQSGTKSESRGVGAGRGRGSHLLQASLVVSRASPRVCCAPVRTCAGSCSDLLCWRSALRLFGKIYLWRSVCHSKPSSSIGTTGKTGQLRDRN